MQQTENESSPAFLHEALIRPEPLAPSAAVVGGSLSGSAHIRELGMRDATDTKIWEYAKANGFTIVSKDSDFQARSLLHGHPPKFIWLRVGNCPVSTIEYLLRKHSAAIHTFNLDPTQSHLMLP